MSQVVTSPIREASPAGHNQSFTRGWSHCTLREANDALWQVQPRVPPFVPCGLRRRGEARVCERTNCDADQRRNALRLPPHRRSARATEVERDAGTAVGTPPEPGRWSRHDHDLIPGEERANAEGRACPALAVEAVAQRDAGRLTAAPDHELSALARCVPEHAPNLNTVHDGTQSWASRSPVLHLAALGRARAGRQARTPCVPGCRCRRGPPRAIV